MAALAAVAYGLGLIFVIDPIETAIQVVLIFAPGNSGHYMDAITVLSPGLHPVRQSGIDAIDKRDIGSQVALLTPLLAGLKTGAFKNLPRVGSEWVVRIRRMRIERSQYNQDRLERSIFI
jgi:hypothetical protein